MPDRKKLILAILIIGICTAFFLSRKYFCLSHEIEKKRQAGGNALLSNEESLLLLNKIQNLLGESAEGKKADRREAGEIFRSPIHPDEEENLPSARQESGAGRETANSKGNERAISSGNIKQDDRIGRADLQQGSGKRNSGIVQEQIKEQTAGETSQKSGLSDGYRSITFLQLKNEPPSFKGGPVSNPKKDDRPEKPESQLPVAYLTQSVPYEEPAKEPEKKSEEPTPTPWSIEFFGRVNAKEGSWVWACNSEGKICGRAQVKKGGLYGVLHVYQDDQETTEKEGMRFEESITFKVDGKVAIPRGPDPAVYRGGSDLKQVNLEVESETQS